MAILRVNRQVYKEAYPIFRDGNQWITFQCNKAGFSKDMKESGFNVIYCGNTRHIKNPILKITAIFSSLLEKNENDTCVLSCYGIHQLPRVLWTAKGMEEMVLGLDVHPAVSKSPKNEDELMFLFNQLRGIRRVDVRGSPRYAESLPKQVTLLYKDAADIRVDLDLCIGQFHMYKKRNRWGEAAAYCEATIAFLADCYKVYGSHFIEDNYLLFMSIRSLTERIAMNLAEAKLQLFDYKLALKYAKYALRISPDFSQNELRLHLLHGQAYTGLKQNSKAMRALLDAQACKPTDSTIIQALGVLKKSLDIDPKEALSKFKELRITAERVQDEDEDALQEMKEELLSGHIVIRPYELNKDGMTHIRDLRNGGEVLYKFAANDTTGQNECLARLHSSSP